MKNFSMQKRLTKAQDQGASGSEYGLIVGLVSVLAIGAVFGAGSEIKNIFDTTNRALTLSFQPENVAPLTVFDVPDVALPAIDEEQSFDIAERDILDSKFIQAGISVTALQATSGGTVAPTQTGWTFAPSPYFNGVARLVMTVQQNNSSDTENNDAPQQTATANVTFDVRPVANTPSLSVKIEPGDGVEPLTVADFSQSGSGVAVDSTRTTWQSPTEDPSYNGIYEVTEVTGSPHDDVFSFDTLSGGSYTVHGNGGNDIIDLSSFTADQVEVNGLTHTITAGGATIFYSGVSKFSFSKNVFTGVPHAIEFDALLFGNTMASDPWIVEGASFKVRPDIRSNRQLKKPFHGVFITYEGTLTQNYDLAIRAASGIGTQEENQDVGGGQRNKNAFILFDANSLSTSKIAAQRNGADRWAIEDRTNNDFQTKAKLDEVLDDNIYYDMILRANGSVASLVVDDVAKASYDFQENLNDGRIGVGVEDSRSDIEVLMAPSNWAPYAKDISIETSLGDGAVTTGDVLAQARDKENSPLSIVSFNATSQKGASVTRDGNAFTYTPKPGFVGSDTFSYTISDGDNLAQGSVEILVSNENTISVPRGTSLKLNVQAQSPDTKGSEILDIKVRDLPSDVVMSDGTNSAQGRQGEISITDWDLENITLDHQINTAGYVFVVETFAVEGESVSQVISREASVSFE